MSATIDQQWMHQAVCVECRWSGDITPSEDHASAQADAHDNEIHNPYDTLDDA